MGFHLVMLHLTLDERSRSKQRSQIYSAVLFSTQSVYRWLFKQLTCRDGSHWFCLEKHRSDLQIVQYCVLLVDSSYAHLHSQLSSTHE